MQHWKLVHDFIEPLIEPLGIANATLQHLLKTGGRSPGSGTAKSRKWRPSRSSSRRAVTRCDCTRARAFSSSFHEAIIWFCIEHLGSYLNEQNYDVSHAHQVLIRDGLGVKAELGVKISGPWKQLTKHMIKYLRFDKIHTDACLLKILSSGRILHVLRLFLTLRHMQRNWVVGNI